MFLLRNSLLGVPIKFVAAEAGCFPPGPLTLLADIMETGQKEKQKEAKVPEIQDLAARKIKGRNTVVEQRDGME